MGLTNPTTYKDVSQILTKYNLWGKLPQNIERLIKRGLEDLEEETPKNISKRHFVEIIASNKTCVNAGINKAKTMGFNTMLLTTYLEGEAKEVVHALSSIVKEIKNSSNPVDIPGQLLLVERQLLRLQEMALAGEIKSSLCHLLLMCRVCQVFLWQRMQQTEGMDPLMLLAHLQQEQRLQEPGLWELTQYYFF